MENVKELESLLSDFDSYEEFMKHMKLWISEYRDEFTPHELAALEWLIAYSAVNPGVCHATAETSFYVIYQYRGGYIDKSSFDSMINTAVELGIITVYETQRINEPKVSHLYRFNNIIELNERLW